MPHPNLKTRVCTPAMAWQAKDRQALRKWPYFARSSDLKQSGQVEAFQLLSVPDIAVRPSISIAKPLSFAEGVQRQSLRRHRADAP